MSKESKSQATDSSRSVMEKREFTDSNSRNSLIQRLRRGKAARAKFVESNVSKAIAFQTRALRDKEGWSQQSLAEKIGSNQNAIYRAENPNYGKQTITTLKKIAAAFDVALVVRFVRFSELIDWVSNTPRIVEGLDASALAVATFNVEEEAGVFGDGRERSDLPAALTRLASGRDAPSAQEQPHPLDFVPPSPLSTLQQPTL
jgi:transcriptional regulator with XRE-family HTH domain